MTNFPTPFIPSLSAMTAIDRQSPKRRDTAHLEQLLMSDTARIIAFVDAKPVIRSDRDPTSATLPLFRPGDCPGGVPQLSDLLFLGVNDVTKDAIFVRTYEPSQAERIDPAGALLAPAVDIRSLAMQGILKPDDLAVAATAAALINWHNTARYCGRCGNPTTSIDGGWSRHCVSCGQNLFPRTDPVVIMLVTSGDQCVLARQSIFPEGMLSALAGFLEPGETIEAAVVREIDEEIGIRANNVHYLASQPWPFPHSLMIGCIASADLVPLTVDQTELESAHWVSRADVRRMLAKEHPQGLWLPGRHAIARTLIKHFAAG